MGSTEFDSERFIHNAGCFAEISVSHDYSNTSVFEKSRLQCSSSTRKREVGVIKLLRFEESFEKLRFRDGLVWTVGLTVEMKLRFQLAPM